MFEFIPTSLDPPIIYITTIIIDSDMGRDSSIYLANASGQDIYCMAVLSRGWAIADFVTDIAELAISALDIAKVVEGLPPNIKTVDDLYQFLKAASGLIHDENQIKNNPQAAANTLVNSFRKKAVHIAYKDITQVDSQDFLQTYISLSGIADLLSAKTVSMLVMNGDGSQIALWDTGNDNSWIATNDTDILRSRHGTIWQRDPGHGNISWPSILNQKYHQTLPYTGDSSRPCPSYSMAFLFLWICILFRAARRYM